MIKFFYEYFSEKNELKIIFNEKINEENFDNAYFNQFILNIYSEFNGLNRNDLKDKFKMVNIILNKNEFTPNDEVVKKILTLGRVLGLGFEDDTVFLLFKKIGDYPHMNTNYFFNRICEYKYKNSNKVLKLLLENEFIDLNEALNSSCHTGKFKIAEYIIKDLKINPFFMSYFIPTKHPRILKLLLDNGVDPSLTHSHIKEAFNDRNIESLKILFRDPRINPSDFDKNIKWNFYIPYLEMIKIFINDDRVNLPDKIVMFNCFKMAVIKKEYNLANKLVFYCDTKDVKNFLIMLNNFCSDKKNLLKECFKNELFNIFLFSKNKKTPEEIEDLILN